jgi:hypothetical protein
VNEDLQHLKLLSIFHYVMAGLTGLFSLLPSFHLVLFSVFLADPEVQGEPPVRVIMGLMMAMIVAMIFAGLAFAACLAAAGRYLAQQRNYTFCLVIAAISCLLVPLGTVLGIFTILVLMRPSVKERFGVAPAGAGAG